MKSSSKYRHIVRLDVSQPGGLNGWRAAVRRCNVRHSKTFPDQAWGGEAQALAAARAWLEELRQSHSAYEERLWRSQQMRSDNSSGLVGVARYELKPSAKGKPPLAVWTAFWAGADGRRRSRAFSVSRWGEEGARLKAIEARELSVALVAAERTTPRRRLS